jgi:hypothetical protein
MFPLCPHRGRTQEEGLLRLHSFHGKQTPSLTLPPAGGEDKNPGRYRHYLLSSRQGRGPDGRAGKMPAIHRRSHLRACRLPLLFPCRGKTQKGVSFGCTVFTGSRPPLQLSPQEDAVRGERTGLPPPLCYALAPAEGRAERARCPRSTEGRICVLAGYLCFSPAGGKHKRGVSFGCAAFTGSRPPSPTLPPRGCREGGEDRIAATALLCARLRRG